jgi:cytochrome c biogenesis protein ResB
LKKLFLKLASLKVAMPLLVVLVVVTIGGSLFPSPDVFRTQWYLLLLGLLGISLLLVTIQHMPAILKKKGRNALIGVVATHLGILIVIAGIIYGGVTGFRHNVRLIEGEATVIPGLPFVMRLDSLTVESYQQEEFPRMDVSALPRKQQDSRITVLKDGEPWRSLTVAPGRPGRVDDIRLVPSLNDVGWYFELVATDTLGREKTIAVPEWEPPLIVLGETQVLTHMAMEEDEPQVGVFSKEGDELISLGLLGPGASLEIGGYNLAMGSIRRYTGLKVYHRPEEGILLIGTAMMFLGLVWHFYFRHRDRRREGNSDA